MIGELLRERKDTIVRRWVEVVLATYPEDAAALFQKERDPFANPLGHTVRTGASEILNAILDQASDEVLEERLDAIVRIRAVQDLTPSQALAFIFSLKGIFRGELAAEAADRRWAGEWAEWDRRVDETGLLAFDVYSRCREEVNQLRINEVKRQMSWLYERLGQRYDAPAGGSDDEGEDTAMYDDVQREDL